MEPASKSTQGTGLRLRSIGEISVLTLFSRILGQIRSTLIAALLGTSSLADSFTIALKIPNFLRSLIAEGASNAVFIPLLSQNTARTDAKKDTKNSTDNKQQSPPIDQTQILSFLFTVTLISVILITLAGIFFAPLLARLLYQPVDLSGVTESFSRELLAEHTGQLMRITFPYLVFISLTALISAYLYTQGKFRAAATMPILLNLSIIVAATLALIFFRGTPMLRMKATFLLAGAVLIGGVIQFAVLALILKRTGVRLAFNIRTVTRTRLQEFSRLLGPVTGSSLIHQLQILLLDPIALSLGAGGVAALFFSNRLLEFPLALMVYPLLTTAFPDLSRYAKHNSAAFEDTFRKNLSLIILLMLFAMSAGLLAHTSVVSLVFGFGAFSQASIDLTASCFAVHLLAMPLIAINRLLTQTLYALKRGKVILLTTILSLVGSVGGSLILIQWIPHVAMVALGALIGAGLSMVALVIALSRSHSLSFSLPREILRKTIFYSVLLAVPAYATYALRRPIDLLFQTLDVIPVEASTLTRKLFEASDIALTFGFFGAFSLLFLQAAQVPEVTEILSRLHHAIISKKSRDDND